MDITAFSELSPGETLLKKLFNHSRKPTNGDRMHCRQHMWTAGSRITLNKLDFAGHAPDAKSRAPDRGAEKHREVVVQKHRSKSTCLGGAP